jgi:hypothetical protein
VRLVSPYQRAGGRRNNEVWKESWLALMPGTKPPEAMRVIRMDAAGVEDLVPPRRMAPHVDEFM